MRNAILSAVVGAALALGVGGSLPVWESPSLFPRFVCGLVADAGPTTGTLWQVVDERSRQIAELRRAGLQVPLTDYTVGLLMPVMLLLAAGAVCGVAARVAWVRFRRLTRG
jgi:hypothetical protein